MTGWTASFRTTTACECLPHKASRPAANLVPPRADDGQPKTKQPRTEEVRMVEVPEDEVMMAVVERSVVCR